MNSQKSMVAASLAADEQRLHRHDAPARRTQLVPGVEPAAGDSRRVPARVMPVASHEPGCGGRGDGPTPEQPEHPACRVCGREWGTYPADRFLTGESSWENGLCSSCVWDAECAPRTIPGTPRTA